MTIPTITAPDTTSTTFATDIETFFGPTLSAWGIAVEAAADALTLADFTGTSATSNAIGLGAKTFTASTGKQFAAGMYVIVADAAAPSTNSMTGQITSYNATTGALVVESLFVHGTGTKTSWLISISGDPATSGVATVSGDISVTNVTAAGKLRSTSKTAGIGYDTGSGGYAQLTGYPYAVVNAVCGSVTMIAGNMNTTLQSYQYLTNSAVTSLKDIILVTMAGSGAGYFYIQANVYSIGLIEFVITNKSSVNRSYTGLNINFAILRNANA